MGTLRKWQRLAKEVVENLRLSGKDRALIAASPGTGKTKFSVSIILDDIRRGTIDGAVIVAPGKTIKSLWKKAFKHEGIEALTDIDNSTLDDRNRRGMELFDPARPVLVVTYSQVASFPELFAVLCARHRIFAVFDEIHHADDEAVFGDALLSGFEDAVFKLSLSGTPFNTSGGRLAFCESESTLNEDGQRVNCTKADYTFSYGEALQAEGTDEDPNVVRSVTFMKWNGFAKWKLYNEKTKTTEDKLIDGSKKSDSLSPLVDTELDSLPKMLRAALAELTEIRLHHKNAGMLIVARDGDHCLEIQKLLRKFGIFDTVVVQYDLPNAQREIERFEKSHDRVIIAIKMLSEGVDIKRLRVGVYASNILTRMFFAQFIGRFIRWDSTLGETQYASIFVPEHVTLIRYSIEIEKMVAEAIIPETVCGPGGGGASPFRLIDKEGDGTLNGAIAHGAVIEPTALTEAAAIRQAALVDCDIDMVLRILAAAKYPIAETLRVQSEEPDPWKQNDKLVGRIVSVAKGKGRTDLTYDRVNAMANRHVGIPKKDKLTPRVTVEARQQYLRTLLTSVYEGNADDSTFA